MGATTRELSDEALLLAARDEPEAFALFYRRYVRMLAAYFWRRTQDAELTADLTAETFAAALDCCERFDPERGPAIGWLYGIANRQLGRLAARRSRRATAGGWAWRASSCTTRSSSASRRTSARARRCASRGARGAAADQRAAVEARFLRELDYAQIARPAGTSELVVRKRVSAASRRCASRTRDLS